MLNIDDERCVHRLSAVARCQACVEACPTRAWSMSVDGLDFDPERCDACGLCVPACPTGALSLDQALAATVSAGEALLACERAPAEIAGSRVPCVHAVSEARLVQLRVDGLNRLAIATGDCSVCPRGGAERLESRLEKLNTLWLNSGLPTVKVVSPTQLSLDNAGAKRRGFLGRLLARPASVLNANGPHRPDNRQAALQGLASQGVKNGLWAVVLNAARCNGCGVCAKLCPEDALKWLESEDHAGLSLQMSRCVGCGLCVDACDQQALSLSEKAEGPPGVVFRNATCASCGGVFRHSESVPPPRRCSVCLSRARRPDRLVVD